MTHAATDSCETTPVNLTLNPESAASCRELKIEGPYQMKLCASGEGELSGEDGSVRFLFQDGDLWAARQDLLDFTNNVVTTEILKINLMRNEFSIYKSKTQANGNVLEQFECSGTL